MVLRKPMESKKLKEAVDKAMTEVSSSRTEVSIETFKEALNPDKYSLDDEWLKQADLYMEWSEHYARAVLERDKAKQQMELTRSKFDKLIRSNSEKFDIDKVTEAAISNCILHQPEYQKVVDDHLTCVYNVNVLGGAIAALDHRKYLLDNLTKLFLSGYYLRSPSAKDGNANTARKLMERELNKE
jgi:hypothetical protein